MPPKTSHCKKCGSEKTFLVRESRNNSVEGTCRKCRRERWRAWREKNPGKSYYNSEKNRALQLKNKFGLSVDDYNMKLAAQDNKCFICKRNSDDFTKRLAVDHDHTTGQVRALLCAGCNTALGSLKENFDSALNLAKYIQEFKGVA